MHRIMGLDVGHRTIGVAVSDLLGITAQGVVTVSRRDIDYDLGELKKIIKEKEIHKIVVGLPKNMDGTTGPQGKKAMEFSELLSERFGLPVAVWDERLTTVSAKNALLEGDMSRKKRKKVIDKIAAVIILQNYLDSQRFKGNND